MTTPADRNRREGDEIDWAELDDDDLLAAARKLIGSAPDDPSVQALFRAILDAPASGDGADAEDPR
ncbi:hypothetical protein [Allonocardiopsis opalescens]|uniref:Uncharacterized protein n=1 Tax=Allonocardiopsis opalescens TaxID=1144618 RepID=A0A2T0Q768_9ACTN|nr:hypothetical protein [Allonocardiopsis opalescens]PRX99677.1 hypothetical protein CLV72_103282 [Allonocardiopsis opalescens]